MRRLVRSCLTFALGCAALSIWSASPTGQGAQDPQPPLPIFRTDVNAVLVDFTVVDREGRFVGDLSRDDVEVFEDGRRQAVSTFSLVDIPIEPDTEPRFDGRLVDRDVASNASEGRLYLIALDDQNLHPFRAPTAIAIARQFIERNLGPHDRAALVAMSGRHSLAHEFTANRQRLLAAVDLLAGGYGGSSSSSCSLADTSGPCPQIRAGVSTGPVRYLESLSRWLAGIEGRRKTIVFISEGFMISDLWYEKPTRLYQSGVEPGVPAGAGVVALPDTGADSFAVDEAASLFDRLSVTAANTAGITKLFEAAARANVTIYTIDPRGNPGAPSSGIRPVTNLVGEDVSSIRRRAEQDALWVLAAETGGFTVQRSNDFTGALDRIVRETSSYYVLGYTSDNVSRDGKFRRLRIRSTRPGVRIRARTGYVATKAIVPKKIPAGWTADHLTMLSTPEQVSGLGLRVTAAPFRGESGKSSVAVVLEAEGSGVRSARADAAAGESFTAIIAAASPDGDVRDAARARFDPAMHTAIRGRVEDRGVRFLTRLDLKPGRYALRVAAVDGVETAVTRGSVYFDLEVPDFSKSPLSLSGVLLTSQTADEMPTLDDDPPSRERLGGRPIATRTFTRSDTITTFAEVYDRERRAAHRVEVVASVRTTDGVVVFNSRQTFDRTRQTVTEDMLHSVSIPLRELSPDTYLLTIEVSTMLKKSVSASREVVFSVR